ncbi:tyrosine--tRNA ligase [Striga asiatica]|uniref:Tyrosine--tRNA ligase n=1 Tax=Striga asiatica TaxID=4170 RepID=A0A5A7Q735_STRAF|nr:tyrosine--tRNA ligase [Striga asiatica]
MNSLNLSEVPLDRNRRSGTILGIGTARPLSTNMPNHDSWCGGPALTMDRSNYSRPLWGNPLVEDCGSAPPAARFHISKFESYRLWSKIEVNGFMFSALVNSDSIFVPTL